jgi:hypothetical protein
LGAGAFIFIDIIGTFGMVVGTFGAGFGAGAFIFIDIVGTFGMVVCAFGTGAGTGTGAGA